LLHLGNGTGIRRATEQQDAHPMCTPKMLRDGSKARYWPVLRRASTAWMYGHDTLITQVVFLPPLFCFPLVCCR